LLAKLKEELPESEFVARFNQSIFDYIQKEIAEAEKLKAETPIDLESKAVKNAADVANIRNESIKTQADAYSKVKGAQGGSGQGAN